jgi:hypothetical protein
MTSDSLRNRPCLMRVVTAPRQEDRPPLADRLARAFVPIALRRRLEGVAGGAEGQPNNRE